MTSITATALRQSLYKAIADVNRENKPIAITNSKGKGAVLIGEDDWAAIEETLYLTSIPRMSESLTDGMNSRIEDCVTEDALEW